MRTLRVDPDRSFCASYLTRQRKLTVCVTTLLSLSNMVSPQRESDKSSSLFARAQELIPGGVNSPVRAFRAVGGTPLFIKSAQGPFITDVDGRRYIDYVGSWGPMILGHSDPEIVAALQAVAAYGTSFGAPNELEVELAEEIADAMPSIEMVRMVNSGTEATMSAIRLARGVTSRDKLIKFEGCYHGHADSLLVKAGSGVATLGLPDSPGVPAALAQQTITVPFNDASAVEDVFKQHDDVAAIIVEPVVGNMGCVPPREGFLQALRELTTRHGALLICDEVDVMRNIAPTGPIYQAGTLSGNPLAMTAGLLTLRRLKDKKVYEELERRSAQLCDGLAAAAADSEIKTTTNRVGSMWTTFFSDGPIIDWTTANKSNRERYGKFFHAMLAEGVYLAPSQFEAGFVSTAHSEEVIEQTITAARNAFQVLTTSPSR